MKVTIEDALSLLSKYAEERTPVLAILGTPSVSVARVVGTIRVSIVGGAPCPLVGREDTASPTRPSFGFPIANLPMAIFGMENLLRTSLKDFWSSGLRRATRFPFLKMKAEGGGYRSRAIGRV